MSASPSKCTSQSSPLRIAEVSLGECEGKLGLTLCPGKKDAGRGWDRDLTADLSAIQRWGASTVLTLIEPQEFVLLQVPEFGDCVARFGLHWIHLPIRDVDVPDERFLTGWNTAGPEVHRRIASGERILIHCRGGIGRTGLVAAQILIERGCSARDAIHRVRAKRPGAIETRAQEKYVLSVQTQPKGGKG